MGHGLFLYQGFDEIDVHRLVLLGFFVKGL